MEYECEIFVTVNVCNIYVLDLSLCLWFPTINSFLRLLLLQLSVFVKVLYEIEVAEKGLIKGERAMMLKSDCNGKQLIAKFTLPSSSLYDLTHFALFNSANFEYDPDSPLSALFPSKGLAQNDPIVLHLKRAW